MDRNSRRRRIFTGALLLQAGAYIALACAQPADIHRSLVSLRTIEAMTLRAKEMLADILHVPAGDIRITRLEPHDWPDSTLECSSKASQVPPGAKSVSGYKIVLEHGGRAYTFHSDLQRVLACPPIEVK